MSLLGARPIRPGELNNYPGYAQRNEIVRRGDYLVQNYLEVPPHIQAAYSIITSRGGDWATVDEATICHTINSLPHGLTEHKIYSRENLKEPSPVDEPGYYQVMRRILTAESLFYQGSHARHILEQLRIPSTTPGSFKHHLQQANISIRLLLNFTRAVSHSAKKPKKLSPPEKPPSSTPKTSSSKPRPPDPQDDMIWPSLQYQNLMRQFYFFDDISRYLHPKQDNHTTLKHRTFLLPDSSAPHDYIDKGVCKINSHTLLFDTTLNNTLMKLIQEVDAKPGVIIREFSFWPDGADTNLPSTPDKCDFYSVHHWLSDNYTIYHHSPPSNLPTGSGFVTCDPKIYILKRAKTPDFKKKTSSLSVSGLLGRARSLSRGVSPSG